MRFMLMPVRTSRRSFLLAAGALAGFPGGRSAAQNPARTAAVEKLLNEGKERFLNRIRSVRDSEWNLRVGELEHSIGQEAEHVALSENELQTQVTAALAEGPRPTLATPLEDKQEMLRKFFAENAVENFRPRNKLISLPEVLEYYAKANRKLMRLLADAENLGEAVHEHPNDAIGYLTGLQWFYYIAYHRLSHIKRIEAVMAHRDFPRREAEEGARKGRPYNN